MTELLPVLAAAFVTGLLGSAHCFGMCGGISGLFAVNVNVASLKTQFPKAITYNAGRVLSYAILGAAVAVLGKTLVAGIPDIAAPVRSIAMPTGRTAATRKTALHSMAR